MDTNIYTCRICGKEFTSSMARPLKNHIKKDHNLVWEDYLREYHPELGGYCLECGKETRLKNYEKGFREFCSQSCGSIYYNKNKSELEKSLTNDKRRKTCLERYGFENSSSSQLIRDKIKQTNLERYGCICTFSTESVKEKTKQTCLKKYGVVHASKATIVKEKTKQTNLERYGVEYPVNCGDCKEKAKQTCLEKYGYENPMQSNIVQEKIKETCILRYNNSTYNNREKAKETCKEIYGVVHPMKNGDIQNKLNINKRYKRYEFFKSQLEMFGNIVLLDTREEFSVSKTHKYFCKVHGEFISEYSNIQKVHCDKCFEGNSIVSISELHITDFLSRYVSTVETSNRTVLSGKELDILIPEKKLAIEFDGLYWHSNVYKEKNYHLEKTLSCEEQNIQLIHIFENEWLHKRPIVESVLLAKLGIFQKRIYGRKCSVKTVSQEAYREFVELNHLQGYVPAKTVLGLFHEDELVEVCSFGKSRFKSGENELLRHCSLLNTQIIGGFSKLISQWKKLNPDQELFTYCDRRYSNGSSYEKSGWTKVSESAPNYFYIVNNSLESRIKYQKHKLSKLLGTFDETLSEQENMSVNGFTWIYDCGNLKYKI